MAMAFPATSSARASGPRKVAMIRLKILNSVLWLTVWLTGNRFKVQSKKFQP